MWNQSKKQFDRETIPLATTFTNIKEVRPDIVGGLIANQKPIEGMLVFRDESGKFGFKDENGKVVIPAQYYQALPFSQGIAAVRLNPWQGPEVGKHCFIDKTGKIVSPIYWRATGFHGKFAAVTMKGSTQIPPGMLPPSTLEERNPQAHKMRMQSLTQMFTRNPMGLIDRNFNYFLPLAERNIEYSKDGYWIITESRKPARVLDLDGREILVTPEPAGYANFGDSRLVFSSSNAGPRKLFFYDKSGQLLKTVDGEIRQTGGGAPVLHVSGMGVDTVDGIIDRDGKVIVKPKNTELKRIRPGRVIKTVFGTTFVQEDWMRPNSDRAREFKFFLNENKLIGMKREELEKILGPGSGTSTNQIVYTLSGFGSWCGNAYTRVVIEIEGDRVKRWKYSSFGSRDEWHE